jgi:hypothetical protein
MAQHYFELFEFALSKNSNQKEFWIIDFLQHYEIESCEQGIEVAKLLFSRNRGVNVGVINCNYSDDEFYEVEGIGPYQF